MTATEFVDQLFAGYTSTAELEDFKAEVLANLQDRIADLELAGASRTEALTIATEELGDISEIAAELSLQRAQDVFTSMYLRHKVRPGRGHILTYIVAGAIVVLGLALIVIGLALGWSVLPLALTAVGLLALPIGILTAAGLTQETTASLPLPRRRAVGYGLGVAVVLTGLLAGGAIVLTNLDQWTTAVAVGLPIVLIGVGILTYLGLTQTNRKKPWVRRQSEVAMPFDFSQRPDRWARFGLLTVAVWIIAVALFFIFGFTIGFQYSWLAFLLALAGMFLLLSWAMKDATKQ